MGPLGLPAVPAMPPVDDRVILIAHSAGGWISRIYLSEARCEQAARLKCDVRVRRMGRACGCMCFYLFTLPSCFRSIFMYVR